MCGDVRDDICSTDNENFDFYGTKCKKIENRDYPGICLDSNSLHAGNMVRLNCPRACTNYCNNNFRRNSSRRDLIRNRDNPISSIERNHLDINGDTSTCKPILERKCTSISIVPFTCEKE